MKLIITASIENTLKKMHVPLRDFVEFLKKTPFGSNKLLEICAPLENTKVYKAYLNPLNRAVIFFIESKGIIYPVYAGNKHDLIAKNITVDIVRKNAEKWQEDFLHDLDKKKYKIRHY